MGERRNSHTPLSRTFFQRDPVICARELVGCVLQWQGCSGIVVETEAYTATNDAACHTWSRPSAREFVAAHEAGAAYVYFNYGMYWMLNVLIKGGTEDGFVLFRAVEPHEGLDVMHARRMAARRTATRALKPTELCSGPGKLAQAFGVTGADHGRDLCDSREIGIFPATTPCAVEEDVRIGISRATELPWRFLAAGNPHVSVPLRSLKPGR
jgi:DNA-3-methyladenine glycosylase